MKPKTKTPFRKLTAAQKRVAIAKDVLKQIAMRKYRVRLGRYISWLEPKSLPVCELIFKQSTLCDPNRQACRVCAIGGAIASGIRLFDKKITGPLMGQGMQAGGIVSEWFTPAQALLIEAAFESTCSQTMQGFDGNFTTIEDHARCIAFRARHRSPVSRAKAIFRNIIANKGEFVP